MTDDLVKRLRFSLRDWDGKSRFHFPQINALTVDEAADCIEAQAAEIERFKQSLTYIRDTTTCEHAHCAAGEALEWSAIAALEGKQ